MRGSETSSRERISGANAVKIIIPQRRLIELIKANETKLMIAFGEWFIYGEYDNDQLA